MSNTDFIRTDYAAFNAPAREIMKRLIAAGRDQIHREWAKLIDEQPEFRVRNAMNYATADIGPEAGKFLNISSEAGYAFAMERIDAMIREASRVRW